MDFAVFISFVLSVTLQAAPTEAPAWSAPTPQVAAGQASPLKADDALGQQPSRMPAILKTNAEEPVQQPEPIQPIEREVAEPFKAEGSSASLLSAPVTKAPVREITREVSPDAFNKAPASTIETPVTAAPRELPATPPNDLEQLIQDSIVAPRNDNRIAGRPVRLLDVLSQPVPMMLQQSQPRTLQPTPLQRGASLLGAPLPANKQVAYTTAVLYKDPQREQARILAYWKLAQSLGQYNLCRQIDDFWGSTSAAPGDEALLQAAKASVKSLLCEARVTLVTNQYALVEAADLIPEEGLPLPSDPPHVGTYFTYFDKLFAGRPAPTLGRRLDATLPLSREALESRAGSTLAAHKAAALLAKEYAAGQCTFAKLASSVARWQEEHNAFLRAAYVYNHDICEYVVSVAGLPADRETLVMMLIRPTYSLTPQAPNGNQLSPVAQPEAMTNGTFSNGDRVIPNNNYQPPQLSTQMPTLAPPREDRGVQPVSGELPALESTPTTAPTQPVQSDTPRILLR